MKKRSDPQNKSKQTNKQKIIIMKVIFIDAFGLCRESFFKIEGLILAFINWFELRENVYTPYTLASSYFYIASSFLTVLSFCFVWLF